MKTKVLVFATAFLASLIFAFQVTAANTTEFFCLLPIWNAIAKAPEVDVKREMDRLKQQIGQNRKYFKVGFAFPFAGDGKRMTVLCKLAHDNNLSLGVIMPFQTHTWAPPEKAASRDFRLYQWRLDGKTWNGIAPGTNFKDVADEVRSGPGPRDTNVVTPSRYAPQAFRQVFHDAATSFGKAVVEADRLYPNTIVFVNGAIEEELANGGKLDDKYLADYSPYAITEYRDWLRHTGIYDDLSGQFAGHGAPEAIVGHFVSNKGAMRSPFYSDPSPETASHHGPSFNEKFGTDFKTWSLRYWDLNKYPEPITDQNFDPSPQTGRGFINGGFDAPRVRDGNSPFWSSWSFESADHNGKQPPGFPKTPAYGFRQIMVKNFVNDLLGWVRETGIASDRIYAHQIPGELVGNRRLLSGADPIWTGKLDASNTLGFTRFGKLDVNKITEQSNNWGIFEWHPHPGLTPGDQNLYTSTGKQLENFYNNGCHVIAFGWWNKHGIIDPTFPLNDSKAAEAVRDWLSSKADVPIPQISR